MCIYTYIIIQSNCFYFYTNLYEDLKEPVLSCSVMLVRDHTLSNLDLMMCLLPSWIFAAAARLFMLSLVSCCLIIVSENIFSLLLRELKCS